MASGLEDDDDEKLSICSPSGKREWELDLWRQAAPLVMLGANIASVLAILENLHAFSSNPPDLPLEQGTPLCLSSESEETKGEEKRPPNSEEAPLTSPSMPTTPPKSISSTTASLYCMEREARSDEVRVREKRMQGEEEEESDGERRSILRREGRSEGFALGLGSENQPGFLLGGAETWK